jgi:hypothetical protein
MFLSSILQALELKRFHYKKIQWVLSNLITDNVISHTILAASLRQSRFLKLANLKGKGLFGKCFYLVIVGQSDENKQKLLY